MNQPRKLRRTTDDRLIAGICGGIARYFDLDPTLIRVAYVLLSILAVGFPGIIIYIILIFVIPPDTSAQ